MSALFNNVSTIQRDLDRKELPEEQDPTTLIGLTKNKSLINLQMSIDNDCVSNLENVEVNPQMEQVKSMILFTSIYQHVHCWYSNDLPQ